MNKNIKNYGYSDFYERQHEDINLGEKELIVGRVIEIQKDQYKIVTEFGEKNAKLKGSLFYNSEICSVYPAVGDFVLTKYNPIGEDIIYEVFERKSKFSRMDSFNRIEQLVATNFDYVCIVTSLNNDFNINRIERYLATAWQSGATPIIILTKSDLCSDYIEKKIMVEGIAIGVHVIVVSSFTGDGIDELKEIIKPGETVVFLGSSGVGKSSLVNSISGEEIMKVNGIREVDSKGRHTTTHRQLIMLKNGTMIIDTPGMRELEMWAVEEGVDSAFEEINQISNRCKFRDCKHENEPGCAVKIALENGDISQERWRNYLKLKREAIFARQKENSNLRLQQKSKNKATRKFAKNIKK